MNDKELRAAARRMKSASNDYHRLHGDTVRMLAGHLRDLGFEVKVITRGYATGREVIEIFLDPEESPQSLPARVAGHKA